MKKTHLAFWISLFLLFLLLPLCGCDNTAHTCDTVWEADQTHHWQNCLDDACTVTDERAPHAFGDWIIDKEATCTPGERHKTCSVCQMTVSESFGGGGEHQLVWQSDETHHWQACANQDCTVCGEKAEHIYSEDYAADETYIYHPCVAEGCSARAQEIKHYMTFSVKDGECALVRCDGSNQGVIIVPSTYNGAPVTKIDGFSFHFLWRVSIVLPNSIKTIDSGAFYSLFFLPSITIPQSVTSIAPGAFFDCSVLDSIIVEEGNPVYHSTDNCLIETESKTLLLGCQSSIIPQDGSVTSIASNAFSGCGLLEEIVIPDGITSIGDRAFYDCRQLKAVHLPRSMTSIGTAAFELCDSLTSITVDSENPIYHADGNCLIETESKTLLLGCQGSIIPQDGSVTRIGDSAFRGCESLTSIVIPNGVTEIGRQAFSSCSSLSSITIPDSVTHIGEYAFFYCSKLATIHFDGTRAEWQAISKKSPWIIGYKPATTVKCTDGDITTE